jgi:hypothetical protein
MADQHLNPYAAPQAVEVSANDSREDALARLRIPSVALLVLALIWAVAGLFGTVVQAGIWIVFIARYGLPDEPRLPNDGATLTTLALGPVFFGASTLIAYGCLMMRRGKRYRISLAAAIMACIPFLSPFAYFGIPFGIWAVVVLRRKDVRAVFTATRVQSTEYPVQGT